MNRDPRQDAQQLVAYVRAATKQLDYLRPRKEDKAFLEQDGKLLYAVDTDVIKLYTNPGEMSVTRKNREGYAQIFPDDDPYLATAIGAALARYVFFYLSENLPLLALPPLNEEMQHVYYGIARDASGELDRAQEQKAKLDEIFEQAEDDEELATLILTRAPDIYKVLWDQGASGELKQFGDLLEESRVAPPCHLLDEDLVKDVNLIQALAPVDQSLQDMFDFRELREAWFDRLRETKSSSRPITLLYDDAVAMARLEWVNDRLEGNKYRLLMITGDQSLFAAAQRYSKGSRSFAEKFLRHPRTYLAEPEVLLTEQGQTSQETGAEGGMANHDDNRFVESLEMLGQSLKLNDSEEALEKSAQSVLDDTPDLLVKFKEKWSKYTSSLAARQIENMEYASEHLNNLHDLQQRLDEKIEETWDSFFKTTTKTGYGLLLYSTSDRRPVRNAPPLRFDSFKKARNFVDIVITEGRLPSGAQQSLKVKEDPWDYTFYLVYALLYAYLGKWGFTKSLAAHATYLADKGKVKAITGREAYFLLAVAVRHSSKKLGDLTDAREYLSMARRLVVEEGHHDRNKDVRFESELLAIDLTAHLFMAFKGDKQAKDIPSLKELQHSAIAQLEELKSGVEPDEIIRVATERNLLTNLFMLTFLRVFGYGEPVDKAELTPWLAYFKKNIDGKNGQVPRLSTLVDIIFHMAVWFLSEDGNKEEKKRNRKSAMKLLEARSVRDYVMPYDKKRIRFFKQCLNGENKSVATGGKDIF
ncbi:hypothetical protein [Thiolapillus brandeum]|uniref:Uncharacterized protein n=1 Tax=Thiolapillus brandeum TaxID=1076588 RepID=A0A7U6JGQ3_9GAMM|nr:hypothetical protein [Thiolapillus brandeum]BAO43043.1 hypothetical protein TBH_C0095 [Thiolapillus brandeum]